MHSESKRKMSPNIESPRHRSPSSRSPRPRMSEGSRPQTGARSSDMRSMTTGRNSELRPTTTGRNSELRHSTGERYSELYTPLKKTDTDDSRSEAVLRITRKRENNKSCFTVGSSPRLDPGDRVTSRDESASRDPIRDRSLSSNLIRRSVKNTRGSIRRSMRLVPSNISETSISGIMNSVNRL